MSAVSHVPRRLASLDALSDPAELGALLGPVREITHHPLAKGSAFSTSTHERLDVELESGARHSCVLKRTDVAADWLARRSGDTRGREALLLAEPRVARMWDAFECPYRAYAIEDGRVGLLLDDLSPWLFADERAPLADASECRLVESLARLHARFWDADLSAVTCLGTPHLMLDLLGPALASDTAELATVHASIREPLARGWQRVRELLPADVAGWLMRPAEELTARWERLPATLLHGDVKVANFAVLPSGRVAAFDWAMALRGPCGSDVGWYLAVNASRLTGAKDAFLDRYRAALEAAGRRLDAHDWEAMVRASVLMGARTLLWNKALALDSGSDAARAEWRWWAERLAAQVGT